MQHQAQKWRIAYRRIHPTFIRLTGYHTGDGFDTLLDSDGVGKILWDGLDIKGANTAGLVPAQWRQLNPTVWQDLSHQLTYSLKTQADGSTALFINQAGGTLRIERWAEGNLGISLSAGGTAAPATLTYNGDQRAPLVGSETALHVTASDPSHNTYLWSATHWAADGTLVGGRAQANFNDVIVGSDVNDRINGLGGNDALAGGAGNDTLDGGLGDDLVAGGAGSDFILGGTGNDMILSAEGFGVLQRTGPNEVWQAPAGKTPWISGSNWGVAYDVNGRYTVYYSDGSTTDTAADTVFAGDGDDRVVTGLGNDYIDGGLGNDNLTGHGGSDLVDGGAGDDVVLGDGLISPGTYDSVAGIDQGNDFLDGGAGADTMLGGGKDDVLLGGIGNDFLWGDDKNEAKLPGLYHGNDHLDGGEGDDRLIGGGKDDSLYGGAGNDFLWGMIKTK